MNNSSTGTPANPLATLAVSPSLREALWGTLWSALIVSCFIFNHSFGGIVHDNLLYLVQALLRVNPEIYAGDAFFEWGSQDRYTLFSPIYSWLISKFSVQTATIGLLLLFQSLFLVGSFVLVCTLIPRGVRGFSMLFIVCSLGIYGGLFLFRMAEPFVTPRGFVEAATLFAIALVLHSRYYAALAFLIAAALLHPLMALAGMAYCWVYLLQQDRRWWRLLFLAVIPVAAGLAGLNPFNQLFETIDRKWLSILIEDNANLFVTLWSHFDWSMIAFDMTVLYMGLRLTDGVARRAFKTALITGIVAAGTTFVFADMFHNVLITSVQPWRALWIVHWMASAAVPLIAWRLWRDIGPARLSAGLLVFAFITRGLTTSLAACVLAVLLYHYRDRIRVSDRLVVTVLLALAAGAFANWLGIALRVQRFIAADASTSIIDFTVRALSKPLPLLVISAGIVWLGLGKMQRTRVAAAAAIALLAISVLFWDQRTPFWRYVESVGLGSHPFSRVVQPHQEVLWHGSATAPWIMMQRRSYFSDNQKSGQMFSREMAIQLNRRKNAIGALSIQEDLCKLMNKLNGRSDSCQPDLEALSQLCRDNHDLDFMVLETRVANRWVASWTWPGAPGGAHYYLYECKTLASI